MSNTDRTCTFDGCTKPQRAKGLCQGHYAQQRLGKPLRPLGWKKPPKPKGPCSVDECGRVAATAGMCNPHYNAARTKGLSCAFDGCDEPVRAVHLCGGHYGQMHAGKDLTVIVRGALDTLDWPTPRKDGVCAIDGCGRASHARGLCNPHYERVRRGWSATGQVRHKNQWVNGKKVCPSCGVEKSASDYHNKLGKKANECRRCVSIRNRVRLYNISWDFAERLLDGAECSVCSEFVIGKKLHIDHCHESGAVRGILCGNCNVALGMVEDDPGRLRALADYLESKLLFPVAG